KASWAPRQGLAQRKARVGRPFRHIRLADLRGSRKRAVEAKGLERATSSHPPVKTSLRIDSCRRAGCPDARQRAIRAAIQHMIGAFGLRDNEFGVQEPVLGCPDCKEVQPVNLLCRVAREGGASAT